MTMTRPRWSTPLAMGASIAVGARLAMLPRALARRIPLATAMACMTIAAPAWAVEPFVVRDIRVEGIQRTDAGTVFSYLPVKVGETFTDEKGTAALKALYATGFFKDVRIDVERDVLVVIVEERPAIAKIEFTGLKEFDKDTLTKALKDIGLSETAIFDRSVLDRAEQELKRQYLTRAKYAADVKATVTPLERNRVNITFNITEGDVATIKQIRIIGNKAFTEKQLVNELALSTPGWFTWYTKTDQYSKQKLTTDLETLRSFYLDRGYLEFNVESTQVSITPNKEDIFITINISEGEKYSVSDVKIAGEALVTEEELRRLISLKPGETYSGAKLTASTKAIQDRLGALGYAFANANANPDINRAEHKVAFTIFVDPGRRVYVRRINVTGNTKTRDEVVRREMRQAEGGWYDVDAIKLSKERLERLAYFKEVNVETPQVAGTNDQVDVNVAVTEKPTGTFNIGAGYGQADGVILSTSVQQANIFGSGQTLGLDVNTSKLNRTIALSGTDPYFTDNGVSRTFDIFYRTTNPNEISLGNFRLRTAGTGLTFGVPFTEYDTVFFGLRFEHTKIDELDSTSPQTYLDYVNQFGAVTNAVLGTVGWARDSRDSGITPTRGRYQRANIEATFPLGQLRYYRASYQQTWYYPIVTNYTLSLNGEVDYGRGFGGKPLPVFKNFYAGGIGSVRGYETSSIGPRDINGDPVGGAKRFNLNAELLFPLPGTGKDKAFRGFVFADAGGVYGEGVPFSAGQRFRTGDTTVTTTDAAGNVTTGTASITRLVGSGIKYSVGFGINWLSPLGALRLSYAVPLKTKPEDKLQRLQFNIGNGF